MEILEKEIRTEEPLLHIHVEIEYPEKKKQIEESLKRKRIQLFIKRCFDFTVSLICILIASPVLLLVAAIIKLTSKGPVLYSNDRVAYGGDTFRCHKFRSMVSNQSKIARDYQAQLAKQEKDGTLFKLENDPRLTWIGKIIRKTSIDELPQLFNVLNGDMSIIGPRPLVPFMLKDLTEFTGIRCMMRPGITGLWQVNDRVNNTHAKFMIKYDIQYIEEFSLWNDLKILVKTPFVVLSGKGAY